MTSRTAHFVYAAIFAVATVSGAATAIAGEEHGHCSGAAVCKGDAACEKQGYKDLSKDECSKISGSKFEASKHEGEDHKDGKHGHDKK